MENYTSKNFLSGMENLIPQKNDSPYKRILAIGDIHGCWYKLTSLLNKLNVADDDLCIFLGDYIDRGNNVAETLEWLIEQRTKKNFVFLAGNHEFMLVDAFKNDRELLDKIFGGEKDRFTNRDVKEYVDATLWVLNGGDKTINALLKLRRKNEFIVDEFLNFIKNLDLSHTIEVDGKTYFFCHAGVRPTVALEEQTVDDLIWIRKEFFHGTRGYNGKEIIVVGHTPTQTLSKRDKDGAVLMTLEDKFLVDYISPKETFDNTKPFAMRNRNILMVDTGSWRSRISAVDIISGQYWQSDEDFREE